MNDYRSYKGIDFSPLFLMHYGIPQTPDGKGSGRYRKDFSVGSDSNDRMHVMNMEWAYDYPHVRNKTLAAHPREKLKDLKRIDEGADIAKIRKSINHPEGESSEGRYYNCPNCATAFEMTERGYDVIARPKKNGSNVGSIERNFVNGKMDLVKTDDLSKNTYELYNKYEKEYSKYLHSVFKNNKKYREAWHAYADALTDERSRAADQAIDKIANQGDGSRGIIVVGWLKSTNPSERTTLFHAMNYTVDNGEVKFYDTQSSKPYKQNGEMGTEFFGDVDPREIYVMQTNNLELSEHSTRAVYSNRRKAS